MHGRGLAGPFVRMDDPIERRELLGRIGAPGDVAAAVHWLLSADAGYITGQVLHVDGGRER